MDTVAEEYIEQPVVASPNCAVDSYGSPDGFLIQSSPSACRGCWGCVRYCPPRAIRVNGDHTEVIEEKCVACGLCVTECAHGGHVVRDDTGAVLELLRSGRPVVALLATEFVAALHPMTPAAVEHKLESMGFHAVESTFLGEELVAEAYERLMTRPNLSLLLRSTCPVAVSWVRKYHPQLVSALAPIVPPYLAQARLIRDLYADDVAIVYVSPCYARKDEIAEDQFHGAIDVAIDFLELKRLMESGRVPEVPVLSASGGSQRPLPLKEVSLIDGFPRQALAARSMTDSDVVAARGLRQLEQLLCAVERGETAPLMIDMLNCEGCVDGPAVNPGMSVFAKRNIVTAQQESNASSLVGGRAILRYLPPVELRHSFTPDPVSVPVPTEDELDALLAEGEFMSRDELIDCGACGYPTCVEHAIAIHQGNSTWEMCFPLQRTRFEREGNRLRENATIDSLTGLWNRRVFNERLADEAARLRRYGTAVSLLMIDLDDFKSINDRYGHMVGDRVLAAVGTLLRESIRETDIPVRYGGDEFALILPGVDKTAAYAVAEKVRGVVRELRVGVKPEGNGTFVSIAVSIGVASAGSTCTDSLELLEAADGALYRAKEAGRDRVMLAPG